MAATRYVAGTLLLTVLLVRYEGVAALRLPRDPLQWLRGVAISVSAVGMFLAVWLMPLAEATTIVFTQPIITAVLAMIFLGERARLSTWLATLVAFAGVFLVLRPNFETAGWGVLLPVLRRDRHGGDDHRQPQGQRAGERAGDAVLHVGHRDAVPARRDHRGAFQRARELPPALARVDDRRGGACSSA
jgi:uncharacterized membrane protein